MSLPFVARTYEMAGPVAGLAESQDVIDQAVERARVKHPDFDHFMPAIEFLSERIFTDHKSLPLDAYIEVLYCAVKHGGFSKDWRKQLRNQLRPPLAGPISAHVN